MTPKDRSRRVEQRDGALKEFETYLKYGGITARITTDWEEYHRFLRMYMKNFVCAPVPEASLTITSSFPGHQRLDVPVMTDFNNIRTVGPGLEVGDGVVVRQDRTRRLTAEFEGGDRIHVSCVDRVRAPSTGDLKAFLRRVRDRVSPPPPSHVFHAFQVHLRLTFHYPLFWLLETLLGWHVMHASAISYRGAGIVLGGLAGVGKSTLAAYLHFHLSNVAVLTDNFLPYDGERVHAFPEPSRLSPEAMDIGSVPLDLPDSFELQGRTYWVPKLPEVVEVRPSKAFLVTLGSAFRREPVPYTSFVQTTLALSGLVSELPYHSYVSVFSLATHRAPSSAESRANTMLECFQDAACAEVTIPRVARFALHHDELVRTLGLDA